MADQSVFRYCGCRNPETGRQYGPECPKLAADPKHGSWRFRIAAGTDPRTGQRRRISQAGFRTRREAETARNKVRRELDQHTYRDDDRRTVGDWLEEWLDRRVAAGKLRPSSERMYRRYVSDDLTPALGTVRLRDLQPHVVDRFVSDQLAAGRGAVTVRRIIAVLSSAMTSARRVRLITVNPCTDVELPDGTAPKLHPWEPSELLTFLALAASHPLGAAFDLLASTGLRRGELLGLRWEDVDLDRRSITVRRQIVQAGTALVEGKPKTRSGEDRRVPLTRGMVGTLLAHQLAQQAQRDLWGSAYQDEGRVFAREDGSVVPPDHLSRVFRTLVKRSGLRPVRLHDLRHGAITMWGQNGVPLHQISKMAGHSTSAFTADRYSHLLEDSFQQAADAMERALGASGPTLAQHGPSAGP